ncbi:M20 family metallopeptidase [Corynebacterium sp. S7]
MDAVVREKMRSTKPAQPPETEHYPGQAALWKRVAEQVEAIREELAFIVRDLHANPELAFEETRSAEVLATTLERQGFVVTRGAHSLPTALRAEWHSQDFDPTRHRTIAVLSEYDALPGIGHACGHNIIAAAGVGAFLGAAGIGSGKVVFLGTPAEEGHTGKEYMIRSGMLDGIDAAVMIHPFNYDLSAHTWIGRRTLKVVFKGTAAHASMQPYMGRNALDAANLVYQGIGLLRQQIPPSDRIHAVIDEGGHRASIIPERAEMSIYVRSLYVDTLMDLSSRLDDILTGAALMAGVEVERSWDTHPMSLPVRNNITLADRWAQTQASRGREVLPFGVLPDSQAASTDFGNVSQLVPGIHPTVKVAPPGVALHTKEFADYAATDEAVRAAIDSAVGLGQVIVDTLHDDHLMEKARSEFENSGGQVRAADLS